MVRPAAPLLTEREGEIMNVLWELGRATAEQIRERLLDSPHDSTVRTMLRVLESKGYVGHDLKGKSYEYRALVPKRKAEDSALAGLLERFFGGSAESLVLRLIEDDRLTPEQLDEIRKQTTPGPRRSKKSKPGENAHD